MLNQFLILLSSLLIYLYSLSISRQDRKSTDTINDGPYIFYVNSGLKVKWIENSILREETVNDQSFGKIKMKFGLLSEYDDMMETYNVKTNYRQNFKKVDSIAVIADVHGEFKSYSVLLTSMGIVDKELNWKFGEGHLVVLGDVFDRGDNVTEIFWHLYGLEKQAARVGGMVHFLLGNHEIMALSKKLNYLNDKYRRVEEITGFNYSDLYSDSTVLGKWLRSKPVIIGINNILFTHGGISIDMVLLNMNIMKVNQIFSTKIVGRSMSDYAGDESILFLAGSKGPLWYRGYFDGDNISKARIDSILNYYLKRHIVVGHTSREEIKQLFNNKVIGIDAGISLGKPGSMLIYKDGHFYKGTCEGDRIKIF